MSEKPSDLTDRPRDEEPVRLLREGLRFLQLSGSIFLHAEFTAPWAYESPESAEIAAMLRPGEKRVILFHIFTEGGCRLVLRRGDETEVAAGDIAIFPFADTHRLGDPSVDRPVPVRELMPPQPWTTMPAIRHGGGGTRTTMVCGYLYSDDLPFNPVLGSLPSVIKVRPTSGGPLARFVEASVQYALASVANAPTDDPLAKKSATSRSVLDERFRALLGRAPMSYLTAFRLQLASRQLETTRAKLAEIAEATGYGSEASLSRAFKRQVGMSPSQRRQAATRRAVADA